MTGSYCIGGKSPEFPLGRMVNSEVAGWSPRCASAGEMPHRLVSRHTSSWMNFRAVIGGKIGKFANECARSQEKSAFARTLLCKKSIMIVVHQQFFGEVFPTYLGPIIGGSGTVAAAKRRFVPNPTDPQANF